MSSQGGCIPHDRGGSSFHSNGVNFKNSGPQIEEVCQRVFVVGEEVTVVKVIVGVMKPKNIDLVEGKISLELTLEADRLREPGVVLVFKAVPLMGPTLPTDGP